MEVSFAHANPTTGNESFLIRFNEPSYQQTPCILVDSGSGVDVSQLLGESEYLLGILLTHAHSDHYCSLSENIQDGANVYTAPDTASVLENVLAEGSRHQNLGDTSVIMEALTPISEWETLLSTVRVRPIPAGHCPGAAGFIIQFEDGEDWRTMLATGDFSLNRAGGYPAFPDDIMLNVEAVFLTGATSSRDDRGKMLQAVVEHATAGSQTLLTATGLAGVEFAYILGHLIDRIPRLTISVKIVGHLAKLYNELSYDVPNVEAVPTFATTYSVMSKGEVTIAGPQVPTEGASGRLFGTIRDNPNAALIQMTDGTFSPIDEGGCTIQAFEYIGHPTELEIDSVVETLAPSEVIITHQMGEGSDRYKDKYASYVWATDNDSWYTLFDETWCSPPWMTDNGREFVRQNPQGLQSSMSVSGDLPLPSLTRHTDIDFQAEGLYIESLERLLQPAIENSAEDIYGVQDSKQESVASETAPQSGKPDGDVSPQRDLKQWDNPSHAVVRVSQCEDGETCLRIVDDEGEGMALDEGTEYSIEIVGEYREA